MRLYILIFLISFNSYSIDWNFKYSGFSEIKKLNLSGFIVGLPLDEAGNMTSQAFDCKTYGEFLFNELRLPFSFVYEHSSTWESTNRFGVKKDKTGLIDSLSAKVILEQWIQEGPELKKLVGNEQI